MCAFGQVAIRQAMEESGGDKTVGKSLRGLPAEALNLTGPAVWVDQAKYWIFIHKLPSGFPDPALRYMHTFSETAAPPGKT